MIGDDELDELEDAALNISVVVLKSKFCGDGGESLLSDRYLIPFVTPILTILLSVGDSRPEDGDDDLTKSMGSTELEVTKLAGCKR